MSDGRRFKLFLKLTWAPFEEQFKSIETRFLNNAGIVINSVIIDSADMGRQYHAYMKEIHERQEGEHYSCKLSMSIIYINFASR